MQAVSHLVKESLPNYLKDLPIPDSVLGRSGAVPFPSVEDPDPYVFGSPGSISTKYGSGSFIIKLK